MGDQLTSYIHEREQQKVARKIETRLDNTTDTIVHNLKQVYFFERGKNVYSMFGFTSLAVQKMIIQSDNQATAGGQV